MRKHEINKRKKVKQNRRASAKSQVSKKHNENLKISRLIESEFLISMLWVYIHAH